MNTSITVREGDPVNWTWLRREARQVGISMEELVLHLIHEKRTKTMPGSKPFHGLLERSTEHGHCPWGVSATGH